MGHSRPPQPPAAAASCNALQTLRDIGAHLMFSGLGLVWVLDFGFWDLVETSAVPFSLQEKRSTRMIGSSGSTMLPSQRRKPAGRCAVSQIRVSCTSTKGRATN